jgi:hypothetical protein
LKKENESLQSTVGSLQNENADQQKQIEALTNSIQEIKDAMQQCGINCFNDATKNSSSSTGENKLLQNIPNPADGSTVIGYVLRSDVSNAKIEIRNISGVLIKSFSVAGTGSISVSTNELASGSYQYSLVIDGRTFDTKQMIITNK